MSTSDPDDGVVAGEAIEPGLVARLADHVLLIELDGEGVIYDECTGAVHLLNPTATAIASCLDGSSNLEDLVRDLAHRFSTDANVVGRDVTELLRSLDRHHLIHGVVEQTVDKP